jgi:hypothetical protein
MAMSDEGPAERGAISTPHSLEDPHPTRLRRATFSLEWEKVCGPITAPILRLLAVPARLRPRAALRPRGEWGPGRAAAVRPRAQNMFHSASARPGHGCGSADIPGSPHPGASRPRMFRGFTPGRSRARGNASPRPIDFVRPPLDHGSAREPIRRLASPAGTGAGPYIRPPSPARAPSPWSTPSWTGAAEV